MAENTAKISSIDAGEPEGKNLRSFSQPSSVEQQKNIVSKFLNSVGDYFEILEPAGTQKTPFGEVVYLGKVIVGADTCILISKVAPALTTSSQESEEALGVTPISCCENHPQFLALAYLLAHDWGSYRLVAIDEDGKPVYESDPAYFTNNLEMPVDRRRFLMACCCLYFEKNLHSVKEMNADELKKLGLVDFIIDFTGKGNAISKGLSELEELRMRFSRPVYTFADKYAAAVLGLYLVSCINYLGPRSVKIVDGFPCARFPIKKGTLLFEAGRFAEYILKTPHSKATLVGMARAVVTQLANPDLCPEADYSSYLDWYDSLNGNLEDNSGYELPWEQGMTVYNSELPLFVCAHRQFLGNRLAEYGSLERLELEDPIEASRRRQEHQRSATITQYWWCPSCKCFYTFTQDVPIDPGDSLLKLYEKLIFKTSKSDSTACSTCRRTWSSKSLKYATLDFYWDWPNTDVVLEIAHLDEGRFVRGWGYIDFGLKRFVPIREQVGDEVIFSELGRFMSTLLKAIEAEREILIRLADNRQPACQFIACGGLTNILVTTGDVESNFESCLACSSLVKSSEQPVSEEGASGTAAPGGSPGYLAQRGGHTYFVLPFNLTQSGNYADLDSNHVDNLRFCYCADWQDWRLLLLDNISKCFYRMNLQFKSQWQGEQQELLVLTSDKAILELNLLNLLVAAFCSNQYPESAAISIAARAGVQFKELEDVYKLARSGQVDSGERTVGVKFDQHTFTYTVKKGQSPERHFSCASLLEAWEGPLGRARYLFSERPLNIWQCACGLPACICANLASEEACQRYGLIPINTAPDYALMDPASKFEIDMFRRYKELEQQRTSENYDDPDQQVKRIKRAKRAADNYVPGEEKIEGGYIATGRRDVQGQNVVYEGAFQHWFPLMDSLNAYQRTRHAEAVPVYSIRCLHHSHDITSADLAELGLEVQTLENWRRRSLDKLRIQVKAYQFGRIWAWAGAELCFVAADPRLVVGISKAGDFKIEPFFKVRVVGRNLVMVAPLNVREQEWQHAERLFERSVYLPIERAGFVYEQAYHCTLARGCFEVEVQ